MSLFRFDGVIGMFLWPARLLACLLGDIIGLVLGLTGKGLTVTMEDVLFYQEPHSCNNLVCIGVDRLEERLRVTCFEGRVTLQHISEGIQYDTARFSLPYGERTMFLGKNQFVVYGHIAIRYIFSQRLVVLLGYQDILSSSGEDIMLSIRRQQLPYGFGERHSLHIVNVN